MTEASYLKHVFSRLLSTVAFLAYPPFLVAGELRWEVEPASGQWSLESPALALRHAATSILVDGQWLTLAHPRLDASEAVTDALGQGRRQVARETLPQGELALAVTLYSEQGRAMVEASFHNTTARPCTVASFRAWQGEVSTAGSAAECRFFQNSGTQGPSGSVSMAEPAPQSSSYVASLYDPSDGESLTAGMISYQRADTRLTAERKAAQTVEFTAEAPFSNVVVPPGATLSSEAYLLEWSRDPLGALERYAGTLAALHHLRVSPDRAGQWNVWYAYDETENTEANLLQCAEYQGRELLRWGIPFLSVGIWQRDNAFMEDRVKPELYPRGLAPLAAELRARGVEPLLGGFFARVTEGTPLYAEHPEWLVKDVAGAPFMVAPKSWGRCPRPHFLPDLTQPLFQEWYRQLWQGFRAAGYRKYFFLDFEGGSSKGQRADPKMNAPFETDRRRIEIVREAVGADAILHTYTSPTNRYLGLVDRVRTSSDVGRMMPHGNWSHIREVSRNISAGWFYHNRVWITDPDPPMVGLRPDPARLEEARIRLLIAAMSGGFITLGERMPEMAPEQFRLLSLAMPPLGTAARPLDLFRRDVPEVHDLAVKTGWDAWHVVSLVNWDDPAHVPAAREMPIEFSDLQLEPGQDYLVFDFWEQKLLGSFRDRLSLTLAPHTSRLVAIRRRPENPWVLGTDLHLSQGGVELPEVRWDAATRTLSGLARRPAGSGHLAVYVPKTWTLQSASAAGSAVATESSGNDVLFLPLSFEGEPVPWSISFVAR